MKASSNLICMLLISMLLILPSCGSDPVPIATIDFDPNQFDGGEMTVKESNGTVSSFHPLLYQDASGGTGTGVNYELTLNLSRAAAETTVIRFTTSGTATLSTATKVGDYSLGIEGDLLVIKKGDKSVTIPFTVYEDYDFEVDSQTALSETFTITLKEIVSGPGKLGTTNTSFDVHILEDDLIVYLDWSATGEDPLPASPNKGDVDLDMFIWLDNKVIAKLNTVGTSAEGINIPGGYPNGTYGYSYTYYEGTSNNVKFYVEFDNFGGTINGTTGTPAFKVYKNTYTMANINAYDQSTGQDPFIAQTGVKSTFNYTFSSVTVNSTGSRIGESGYSYPKSLTSNLPIKNIDARTMQILKKLN